MNETRNTLTFAQRFEIASAVQANTEPEGEGFCRYLNGKSDALLAADLSEKVGVVITAANVKSVRREIAGGLRLRRTTHTDNAKLQADVERLFGQIEQLRAVIGVQAKKIDNLRQVIEHFDAVQHKRRAECSAKVREIIGTKRVDERVMRTQMRSSGFSDDEISMSLYLTGAIIRANGAGSTVEIAR